MAGRPTLKKLEQDIRDAGGDEVIFERIAEGEKLKEIARSFGVSRALLYDWRDRGGDDRKKGWSTAMRARAAAQAEEAGEILDNLVGSEISNADVKLATERANYRKWLASKLDPETFGEQQGVQVQLNISQLHLQALKAANAAATLPASQPAPELLPAEVVED